jgi:hypothetical protein
VNELAKIISVFLASAVAFGKLGMPTAVALFKFDFMRVILVSCAGGIAGNLFFTYLSAAIFKGVHNYRARKNLIHKKKIFNRFTRRIIRVKQKFGLVGIAFITPMFLSTPLGAFIAGRFYRNKRRIVLYFSISMVFWAVFLYFIFFFFFDKFHGWLI